MVLKSKDLSAQLIGSAWAAGEARRHTAKKKALNYMDNNLLIAIISFEILYHKVTGKKLEED